jgi:hypothetical protein
MEKALKHNVDLPEPWCRRSADQYQYYEAELKREIANNEKHQLYGVRTKPLANSLAAMTFCSKLRASCLNS